MVGILATVSINLSRRWRTRGGQRRARGHTPSECTVLCCRHVMTTPLRSDCVQIPQPAPRSPTPLIYTRVSSQCIEHVCPWLIPTAAYILLSPHLSSPHRTAPHIRPHPPPLIAIPLPIAISPSYIANLPTAQPPSPTTPRPHPRNLPRRTPAPGRRSRRPAGRTSRIASQGTGTGRRDGASEARRRSSGRGLGGGVEFEDGWGGG